MFFLIDLLLNGLLKWAFEEHPFITAILVLSFIALCFYLVGRAA